MLLASKAGGGGSRGDACADTWVGFSEQPNSIDTQRVARTMPDMRHFIDNLKR